MKSQLHNTKQEHQNLKYAKSQILLQRYLKSDQIPLNYSYAYWQ